MKYVSIDLETTGLDPEKHQILTFSGILDNTEKELDYDESPKFNIYVLREDIVGSPFAIGMNSEIIERISEYMSTKDPSKRGILRRIVDGVFLYEYEIPFYVYIWFLVNHEGFKEYEAILYSEEWGSRRNLLIHEIYQIKNKHSKIGCNVAGKNFSSFDKGFIDKIDKIYDFIYFRQRVLDPSILYMDWEKDEVVPNLSTCKKRADLDDFVSHQSLDDAWDIILLLRNKYKGQISSRN